MLEQIGMDNHDPYWSMDAASPTKRKCAAAEDKLLDDSVSLVKMAASQKKKVTLFTKKCKQQVCKAKVEKEMD